MKRTPMLLVLAGVLVGCSGNPNVKPTVPVSGIVTYKGAPVAGATVAFSPAKNEPGNFSARGTTDDQGKYTLKTFFGATADKDGAVAGEYIATVVKMKPVAQEAATGASPSPEQMSQRMGNANKDRKAPASTPRMGPMGRPAGAGAPAGPAISQADSEIPVRYASSMTSPLSIRVPGGKYDFELTEK